MYKKIFVLLSLLMITTALCSRVYSALPLEGKVIVVNPGHGLIWETALTPDAFTTERGASYGGIEDYSNPMHTWHIMNYLISNGGADAYQVREYLNYGKSTVKYELAHPYSGAENQALWKMTAPYWMKKDSLGLLIPETVHRTNYYYTNPNTPQEANEKNRSNRSRPFFANWLMKEKVGQCDLMVTVHTNAASGTSRGTLMLIDTDNNSTDAEDYDGGDLSGHTAIYNEAKTLSTTVLNKIVSLLQTYVDPTWSKNGTSGFLYRSFSYAENRYAQMPYAMIEAGFHDNTTDGPQMVTDRWNIIFGQAVYKAICDYYSITDYNLPSQVTTLTATQGTSPGEVRLRWIAPGEDATIGSASAYTVKYSAAAIDTVTKFNNATTYTQTWAPKKRYAQEDYILTGFTEGTTYYFAVRAKNFTNDTSRVSNTIAAYAQTSGGAPGDTAAPSAVNSLTAATGSSEGSVVLTWNSTGDDAGTGNLTGQYKIQYLTINSGWNDSSAQIVLSTTNITPGTVRVWDISSGLTAGVTYYFSVWSVDEAGNVSAVSNHPSAPAYKVYSGTQTTAGVYYGHEGLYSLGTGGNKVDTANERVSYRFTAQVTGNITSVYVPIFSVTGNPPAFYCGIQNDTSGNPAEAWLTGSAPGTFDATASGWQKVVLVSPANVTQGQVYHIVVEQVSTAPGTSNNIWLTSGLDYTKVLPLYNTLDANASSLRDSGTGTWAVLNGKQPVYLVEYDNGSVYGNPWNTNTDTDIYDVVTTGWEFTLDNVAADISITTLEAYIQKVYDDSGDDLYYEIRDITSGSTVVKSGTFATEASFVLSSSYTWKSMDISPALTLTKGKKYRITFSSPYSYGGYRLHIPRTTGNGISYVNTTYNSGSSYSVTDTGSGNVADTNADPAIRMTAAGVQFADTTPPGKVVNLIAQPGVNTGELILQWSTPGDDDAAGNLTGSYNIEYLTVNTGWSRAGSQIITSVSNVIPGTAVNLTLTGLVSGATYYFRMWYADEETNWSESSNIVLSYAKPAVVADTTPPAGINTLVAMSNQTQLQVSLNWQSTGDDGSIGNISGFYSLQYLTTDGPWDVESAQVVIATSSIVPGSQQSYTLAQALAEGVTYYFSLWTTDDALNVSPQSNIAVVYVSPQTVADTIAPGAITNLTAVSGNVSGQVILSWTSPGNDGYVNLLNGNVLIQYATVDSGWDAQAAQVVVPMSNINPGSTQSYSVISPLIPGTTYYFSAWVRDAANNISAVSNHPSAVAQKMPGSVSGIIRQAVTLTPVAGAVIEILQDNAVITQTSSNQNGVYILQLTTGTYNLRVSAERYQTSIASDIVVGLESSVQVNIDLTLLSNTAPSLSWTNETGYTTAGVAPLTGRPGANFIFRVKYRDTEDDPPLSSYPKVHIKKSGVEVIVATLTAVGNNYSQGAVYAATVTFTSGGSYTYWFEAYDIYYATASGVPTNEMSGLQVLNRSPVLSWTGETGYFNTGEKPVTGTVEDLITYRVKYVDYDGDTPLTGYPRVVIKLEGNDFVTIPLNVSTGPYTTGVICSTSVVLSFAGRYTYKFEAYDKYNAKASGLPVSNNDGPTISGYNLTPEVFLQWTDETGYKDTAVKPSFGTTSTTFYFRVQYINYHNLPPKLGYPKLHIKDYTGLIFSSTMTIVVSSNTAYSEGVVYALPVKNMGLGINYSYLLECQDVTGAAAAGVAAKYYHGPEVMVLVNVSTASAVVNWPDGTIISVPKLAFSTASYVAVGIPETIPPVLYDTGRKETGVIKNVVFDNTIVTPNAKIKLQVPFTSQDVNGLDPAGLVLCWYNSTNGEWVPIINSRSLYPLDNKVEADITVSGLYRLFEYESGAELLPPAVKVTNYPNPLVIGGPGSGKTAIRYSLPEDSGVEVKIYDLSGRLVREWKIQVGNSGAFAGNHSVEWDGKNDAGNYVTAGGYICIVKTKKGVAKTKIAVQ